MTSRGTKTLRRRILTASRDRFLRDGFHRTTIDDIAAGLGMSKKSFYLGFSGKEQLVEQIVEEFLAEIRVAMDSIRQSDQNFILKLHSILTFMGRMGERIGKPFINDLERHLPHLWTRIQEFRRVRINEHFSNLLDQGIREGYVKSSINRRIFMRSYLASVEAIVNPSVLMTEPYSAREAIQGILEIFFRGILTGDGQRDFKRAEKKHSYHQPEVP